MLATQPPINELNLRYNIEAPGSHYIRFSPSDGSAITLRDIVIAAAEPHRGFWLLEGGRRFCGRAGDGTAPFFRMTSRSDHLKRRPLGLANDLAIYQPLHVEKPKDTNEPLTMSVEGRLLECRDPDNVGFQRAWETVLRCVVELTQ